MEITVSRCEAAPANRIYILDTLLSHELQTGRSKYERVRDEVLAQSPDQAEFLGKQVSHTKCADRDSIVLMFKKIAAQCSADTNPLIFIDGHGNDKLGLQLKSGEFLNWAEFNDNLKSISTAAFGQLTVVSSFCHSMCALDKVALDKPLPCPFYYGYPGEISAGEIQDEGTLIVSDLLQKGRVDRSKKKVLLHTEYDHAMQLIAVLSMKFLRPHETAAIFPELSKNSLRKKLRSEIGADFGKVGGLNKLLTKAFDIRVIIKHILDGVMYDTDRRERFTQEVVKQLIAADAATK